MKISTLFVFVAAATMDTLLVGADECTTAQLTTIGDIYTSASSKGIAACPDVTSTTDVTTSDYCSNSDCLKFMSEMLSKFPDCSTGGVNLRQGLQSAVDYCTNGKTDMSGVFTDTSSSSALATDSSSTLATNSPSSSALTTASSSSTSLLRTTSPSTGTTASSTSSDKVTANTVPPATAKGSSAAPAIGMAISSAVLGVTAFIFTATF
ncbi:elicitin [Phytophthora cinnamomi]|uniref:elicitin n=1 Tax=Phytophthora cinnamomi TaxID=4785 RepID=UPI003559EB2F|nr:elicitin [Phytophthora cinnamomi]KAG6587167.1 elicitin [Phytophthora cinnamomi]